MKLLMMLTPEYDPHKGGVQRSTYKLANHFLEKGMDVSVLSLRYGTDRTDNGVPVYYLQNREGYHTSKNRKFLREFLEKHWFDVIINQMGYEYRLAKTLHRCNTTGSRIINTIRINPIHFLEHYKEIAKRRLKPFFLFNHAFFWWLLRTYHIAKQKFVLKALFKYADKVVLLSPRFKKEVEFFYPEYPREKLTAIPNPFIKPDYDPENPKVNAVLFVGRLNVQQKRVDLLMKILEKLAPANPDWEFWIVGDGPMKKFVEDEIGRIAGENIRFFGYRDPDPFYEKAKILLFTSAYEGFGNVLVEAQFFGTVPVLFNSYSAVDDIVKHDESGLLIEPFDIETFVDSAESLIKDEKKLESLSTNTLVNANRFSIKRIGQKWVSLFNELM